MSGGNNFLNIPGQENLFKTVKNARSAEETCSSTAEDEEDEEAEESHRLIPRSSPVPRRRGMSIFDETAEYMRIRLALPSRRVSFADSSGGELVEVKEFVAFDSDEEEDSRWEEEEARYRPPRREPTYEVCPDFQVPTGAALILAVHTNKVEVENVSTVEDEPLAFTGLIRVLNISFHKAVYVRFTMDGWSSFFDYPAEYVQGSNDVETDKYSFKLSFAPPYLNHGARIEFVVRFETPEGDYWANNGGKNYTMVLNLSYKDNCARGGGTDDRNPKSILKATSSRMEDDYDETMAADEEEEELRSTEAQTSARKPSPAQPQVTHPKIDIETSQNSSDVLRLKMPYPVLLPSPKQIFNQQMMFQFVLLLPAMKISSPLQPRNGR
ncbi:hypothetical protein MATL_G00070360 [Megalops atlanticus]|uniref:CBM21 domain-containing protein n=1 Tax=Megalops atlanticus TaxID=7932 RepID=A0A9D3Q9M2_MEGAT|nr:hypothetical protein MATL_G00070360 [Megalops atlanticus]